MTGMQIDIFGGETEAAEVTAKPAPLTPAQHEIMRLIRQYGAITSTQAGTIVHAHRDPPCRGCQRRETACPYRSSDGSDALKRLMGRGLVRRARPGTWILAS